MMRIAHVVSVPCKYAPYAWVKSKISLRFSYSHDVCGIECRVYIRNLLGCLRLGWLKIA